MDTLVAARRWATTWERSWPSSDVDAIAALYAPGAPYRSHPHRQPEVGSAAGYTTRTFAEETDIHCTFGEPIAMGDRAAVEWWASWVEDGAELTLSGTTILRFDSDGLVREHVDYWVDSPGRMSPYPGWANR